ncbi:MAG: TRZ/ATZ family protein [Clostridiales bacterium]|nr:MAG: TRZ/ATZ family protein [Clostridiales bacterium]
MICLNTSQINDIRKLPVGTTLLLSGKVYTARDAAHKKIAGLIKENKPLPFPLENSFIYFAGPTPAKNGLAVGACGPTTSSRMDVYTPALMDLGLFATIGKGERSIEVIEACKRNKGVYLCALGGAGALASKAITSSKVIAFDELGCESIKELEIQDFRLTVAVDAEGNNIFKHIGG